MANVVFTSLYIFKLRMSETDKIVFTPRMRKLDKMIFVSAITFGSKTTFTPHLLKT